MKIPIRDSSRKRESERRPPKMIVGVYEGTRIFVTAPKKPPKKNDRYNKKGTECGVEHLEKKP
jgi:hypothetical protein